jgi:hypothetical protein
MNIAWPYWYTGIICIALYLCAPLTANGQGEEKKAFMKAAIASIDAHNDKIDAERKRIEKEGGRAPLFVRIPRVIPFGDWDYYYIDDDLKWTPNPGQSFKPVNVPKGFVTDLASVPAFRWGAYPPTGRYAYAAIVHDYLYWTQTLTQKESDDILKAAMEDSRVDSTTVSRFHWWLGQVGARAWASNQQAKKNGEKRFLVAFPQDRLISWTEWKKNKSHFRD